MHVLYLSHYYLAVLLLLVYILVPVYYTLLLTMFATTIKAFLIVVGINALIEKFLESYPRKNTFKIILQDKGLDILSLI